jgi:hypothetical protein
MRRQSFPVADQDLVPCNPDTGRIPCSRNKTLAGGRACSADIKYRKAIIVGMGYKKGLFVGAQGYVVGGWARGAPA